MSSISFSPSQQSRSLTSVPGSWKLVAGSAISLQPRQSGVLRIVQGQAWATLDVAPQGHANQSGDHVLQSRQGMVVRAGQHLVVETLERAGGPAVFFEWTPLTQAAGAQAYQGAGAVTRPLADLGDAVGMAGKALLQLCAGLLGYARQRVLGRGAASAPASAQLPHCG